MPSAPVPHSLDRLEALADVLTKQVGSQCVGAKKVLSVLHERLWLFA